MSLDLSSARLRARVYYVLWRGDGYAVAQIIPLWVYSSLESDIRSVFINGREDQILWA